MPAIFPTFQLNLDTLLLSAGAPFLYFFYHFQLRNWPVRRRKADIIFLTAVIVFGLAIFQNRQNIDFDGPVWKPLVLHLLPLIASLGFFVIGRRQHTVVTMGHAPGIPGHALAYRPVPLNNAVEAVSWDQLVIDPALKEELSSIINLLKDPRIAQNYGIEVPRGILLNGPPGTGKTSVAKVIAAQAGLSFFALKADEVISKWVGDSEKNLSALFEAAQRFAPAVIFIDEIDSIGKQRSGAGGQEHRESFLNHLLQLMDGIIGMRGVYIIAATNRADLVDAALKRPGRLNKVVNLPLPDLGARSRLFKMYLSKIELADEINVDVLAHMTEARSPAVIKEICNQAGLNAFKRESTGGKRKFRVTRNDLELALAEFL